MRSKKEGVDQGEQKAEARKAVPENANKENTTPLTDKQRRKELEILKPLHWAFVERHDPRLERSRFRYLLAIPSIVDELGNDVVGREDPDDDYNIEDLLNSIRAYHNYKFAEPQLKELINKYLVLREIREEIKGNEKRVKYDLDATKLINAMVPLIEARYKELSAEEN